MERLAKWLKKVEPTMMQVLDSNWEQRAFANYEVHWDEEREDINEIHCLKTEFDFKEANRAV